MLGVMGRASAAYTITTSHMLGNNRAVLGPNFVLWDSNSQTVALDMQGGFHLARKARS